MNERRRHAVGRLLTVWVPVVLLLAATPASADEVDRWRPLIDEASLRFGIPNTWIERVMRAESRGVVTLNGRPIRSRVGAIGLMQLMPSTWAEMRARLALGDNPDDPHDNILAGTLYLRLMYDRFGYPGLFGAYNVGPARYAAYLAGGQRLPAETIAYLGTVGGATTAQSDMRTVSPPQALFVVRREQPINPPPPANQPSLFAIRNDTP